MPTLRTCVVVLFFPHLASAAPFDTPAYFQCNNRVNGSWDFGRVPYGCDVDPWGEPEYVADYFAEVVFDDNVERSAERARYMEEMHAVLRDSAAYYFLHRKPGASNAEVSAWLRAILAKAHQETYWTHYRDATDGRTKMIRGDSGHGHGLVQIDDRWHFTALEEGKGWHLLENIIYGMELFFDAWETAATASCVSSPSDWRSRARSAYSVYNGGPTKICRWTNPNDPWAHNDRGFRDKYDDRLWEGFITDLAYVTFINVPCFMEGNRMCDPIDPVDADDPANWPGRRVQMPNGRHCVFTGGGFECVAARADFMCLAIQHGETHGWLAPSEAAVAGYDVHVQGKHKCFRDAVDGLRTVGKSFTANLRINIRESPGGSRLGVTTQSGKTYQVLDYVVTTMEQDRYYLVREGTEQGYIFAGDAGDFGHWTTPVAHEELTDEQIIIPQPGDEIRIVPASGINLRSTPGGILMHTVGANNEYEVQKAAVRGATNKIYFQITDQGRTGYIYSGKVLEGTTVDAWTVLAPEYATAGSVIEVVNGINLRSTPGGSLFHTVPGGTLLYVFDTVVRGTKDHLYYEVTHDGAHGFIYGGQLAGTASVDNWVREVDVGLAGAGDTLRIVAPSGINVRRTPGGTLVGSVAAGTEHEVISTVVRGDDNYVYYEIPSGFFFAGKLTPASTLAAWAIIVP